MPIGAGVHFRCWLPAAQTGQWFDQKFIQALDEVGEGMIKDLQAITSRWKHKVTWRKNKARATTVRQMTMMVWTTDKVFHYLDKGTRRHFVAPRNKKALHWVEQGEDRFSKGHFVSGVKPRKYLAETKGKWDKRYKAIMQQAMLEGARLMRTRSGPGQIRMR
jgi:hypothetical protein